MKLRLLVTLLAGISFNFPVHIFSQQFRADLQYDALDGIVKLGWNSGSGIWSGLESSTNLLEWREVLGSSQFPLRFEGNTGNRVDIEISAPNSTLIFYRVRKLNLIVVGNGRDRDDVAMKDVNDAGRVVGFFQDSIDAWNIPNQGFTWAPGEPFINFGNGTGAVAVNGQGVVLGYTNIVQPNGSMKTHFFSWTSGAGMLVHEEGSPVDINSSGHVLGSEPLPPTPSRPFPNRTFLWKPGVGKIYLPHLAPENGSSVPIALSDAGHVVGHSAINDDVRAFYWTETGGIVDITKAQSNVIDVNDSGQAIGDRVLSDGSRRNYIWSVSSGIVNLPTSVMYTTDINNQGQVVGSFIQDSQNHGFLWTRTGGIVDLGVLTPGSGGWSASNAVRVNDNSQAIGDSIVPPGIARPFFWSADSGIAPLDVLSLNHAIAVLINNNNLVFGYGKGTSGIAPHIFVWDMSDLK